MNHYWITSFVQTKLNGGGDWQAYGKEMPLESERTLDKFYEPLVVQIGVGEGHDTCELTRAVNYHNGKLIAIDWFEGNISTPEGELIDAHNHTEDTAKIDKRYKGVLNKLRTETGCAEITTLIKGNSHDELEKLEDESIDILFIDGGHEYSIVKKDIEIGWRKLKPGGYICGDDYSGDYHYHKIDEASEEQLEQDTIKGDGYIKIADGNGVLVSVNNVHAGVIKAVHEFFGGQASVNNWGRYWYFKKS